MTKKVRRYVHSFWHNPGTWWTDRQTDTQTYRPHDDIGRAYATHRAEKNAFDASVRGRGRRNITMTVGVEKLEWYGYPMVKRFEDMFIRFDRIHEIAFDGQTDRWTRTHTAWRLRPRLHSIRGKNTRGLCRHAVSDFVSVTFVNSVETNTHNLKNVSPLGSHVGQIAAGFPISVTFCVRSSFLTISATDIHPRSTECTCISCILIIF